MISAVGKSGARSSGPTGWRVPGCNGGGGGAGRSGTMLYHCCGISDSCSTYLTWFDMLPPGHQRSQMEQHLDGAALSDNNLAHRGAVRQFALARPLAALS